MDEYLTLAGKYALLLFDAGQWRAIVIMLIAVFSITEIVKRLFFMNLKASRKDFTMFVTAVLAGVASAVTGYFVSPVKIPLWFWLLCGLMLGPVSNWLHKGAFIVLALWKPDVAAAWKGKKSGQKP